MDIRKIDIMILNPAKYNPKVDLKETDKEYQDIKNSIEKFGYIEPIVINKDNTIIGGHQRYKVLKDLKFKEVQCVVVDLNKNDEKVLNVALNKIQGKFDDKKLFELLEEIKNNDLDDFLLTGFDELELNELIEQLNNINIDNESSNNNYGEQTEDKKYTSKVETPIYSPKLEKIPEINEIIDATKTNKLIEKINLLKCSKEIKEFLILSAHRFTIFNYEMIAEYYCHSNKEIQEIMEDMALVIIDINKAIENGFTNFNKSIIDNCEYYNKGDE